MRAGSDDRHRRARVLETVIAQHRHDDRRTGVRGDGVVGNVDHWRHHDVKRRCHGAVAVAVGRGVGDLRHGAVPVGHRREDVGAVRRDGKRAHAGDGDAAARCRRLPVHHELRDLKGVGFGIGFVAQHIAGGGRVLRH